MFLPQANIQTGTDYTQSFSGWNYISLLGVAPSFRVNATTASFNNSANGGLIPLNRANISLVSVGGLQLIGISGEQPLSTSPLVLYTSLVSLLSGPITANVRVVTQGFPWIAGVYDSGITFSLAGVNLGGITPSNGLPFNLDVPGFISVPPSLGTVSFLVNDLNYYRSANGISVEKLLPISTTVPYIPSVRAASAQFSFNTSLPFNDAPASPVSAVTTELVSIPSATSVSLSTTDAPLTVTTGIPVAMNNQVLTNSYSINAVSLKKDFLQAGVYEVPLNYTWNKLASAYPAGALQSQASGTLEVIVSDLAEIIVNQQTINLNFNTAADYASGVSVDIPAQLRISKTTPYNLTVRSTAAAFSAAGNSIPLSVMRIGPASTGEDSMNTIILSGTAQSLFENANPAIDKPVGIRFSIPASESEHLLGKPAGSYSADIIFGIVAP